MYTFPDPSQPVRQGDIFRWLPKVEVVLGDANLPLLSEYQERGAKVVDWLQLAKENGQALANIMVKPVYGIILTQDCDASRCINVAFAEVRLFSDVYKQYKEGSPTKTLISVLTEHARKNQKWYYLAEHPRIGFEKKMGADFQSVFEVPRAMLENYKEILRLGRLDDDVAWPHFRERVSEFFRRYPYNEWYPFNLDELKDYESKYNRVDLYYPWQQE